MSTSGLVVSTAPTSGSAPAEHVDDAGGDVGVVGDQLAERQRDQRGVGRGLEHDGAAGGQRGRQLGQRQLVGIVVGDDRGDHAARLPSRPSGGAACRGSRCCRGPRSSDRSSADRRSSATISIGWSSCAPWHSASVAPTSAMVSAASSSRWSTQRLVQLLEAADPQLDVRSTSRWCRTPARGSDRGFGVGDGGVGRVAEHLAGGRVERRKRPVGLDQLSVDQQPARRRRVAALAVTRDRGCFLHHPPWRAASSDSVG